MFTNLKILPFVKLVIDGIDTYRCRLGAISLLTTDVSLIEEGSVYVKDPFINENKLYNYSMSLPVNAMATPSGATDTYNLTADPLTALTAAEQQPFIVAANGSIDSVVYDGIVDTPTRIEYSFLEAGLNSASLKVQLWGIIFLNTFTTEIAPGIAHTINSTLSKLDGSSSTSFINTVGVTDPNTDIAVDIVTAAEAAIGTDAKAYTDAQILKTKLHIDHIRWYSSDDLNSVKIDNMQLLCHNSYWCEIDAFHDSIARELLTFGLTTATPNIVITQISNSMFRVDIGEVELGGGPAIPVDFTVTVSDGVAPPVIHTHGTLIINEVIICAGIGLIEADELTGTAVDSKENVIVVGYSKYRGAGKKDAFILKIANSITSSIGKVYGGTDDDRFTKVFIDPDDNIICVGYTKSSGFGKEDCLLVKFNPTMDVIARKVIGGGSGDQFYNVIADSTGDIICIGATDSEGPGRYSGLVVKLDSNFNILARKVIGGTDFDYFHGVTVDSTDNIFISGYTKSKGAGDNDCLIIKLDTNLTTLAEKTYGNVTPDSFFQVVIDTTDDSVICVGNSDTKGLVVRFSNTLTIVSEVTIAYGNECVLYGVVINSSGKVICCGYAEEVSTGKDIGIVVTFDNTLTFIDSITYGGLDNDYLYDLTLDNNNNIMVTGSTKSDGQGDYDGIGLKWYSDNLFPSGTFSSTKLSDISLSTILPTIATATGIVADVVMTSTDSTLNSTKPSMTLQHARLTTIVDALS